MLVISAFPGDYAPTPNSLIGGLKRKGLSVADLSFDKAADLRSTFSCWLSNEIPVLEGLRFKRVLCFEPMERGPAPKLVGDIFRALTPFTFAEPNIRSIAMPVVASGEQRYSIERMLPPLMEAAVNWLQIGLPVDVIKLVIRNEQQLAYARPLFAKLAQSRHPLSRKRRLWPLRTWFRRSKRPVDRKFRYDVFVSYSRTDERYARRLADALSRHGLMVFVDRTGIDVGAAWQQEIFDALEECRFVAFLYSPDFLSSPVCKDEFNIAWIRRREQRGDVFPILLRDTDLPTYMRLVQFSDCRINDVTRLQLAADQLAARVVPNDAAKSQRT